VDVGRDGVSHSHTPGSMGPMQLPKGAMASVWSASLNGGLGQSPQQGPGAEPLVGVRGQGPPEAESFLYIFYTKSGQKLRI